MAYITSSVSFLRITIALGVVGLCYAQVPSDINTRGIEFPEFRYRQYQYLDDEQIDIVTSLGWVESTWDIPGTDDSELIPFDGWGGSSSFILQLGFTAETWDCWVVHYMNPNFFDWRTLEEVGVQEYFVGIGWTDATWGSLDTTQHPESLSLTWEELTDDQRSNATELCYFAETWDMASIQSWTTYRPTSSPSESPSIATSAPTVSPTVPTSAPTSGSAAANVLVSAVAIVVIALGV
jgi:hypothetical protein